jgi:hypothetical protein
MPDDDSTEDANADANDNAPAHPESGGGGSGSVGDDDLPYSHAAAAAAVTDAVEVETHVEDAGENTVARSATFADVANRPKEQAINDADTINDVVFYDQLVEFDGDLAGTIRAKSQVAGMGAEVTHPAMRGREEELSEIEQRIMRACETDLLVGLDLRRRMQAIFRRLIIHGNEIAHIKYADGEGVTGLQELPLRALTIVDEDTHENSEVSATGDKPGPLLDSGSGEADMEKTIHDADRYVLNEGDSDSRQSYYREEILHLAINKHGNWYTDRVGRDTFGIWGERRLEPIKFAMQAKANTLANKVALDDSLLAREVYHIDIETLYGHIQNDKERTQKAKEYKNKLKRQLNNLAPDEKPILPEEVSVSVQGPDGSTADNQTGFIEMMNNTMQHALTFHSASFGRDAGGSLAGNRPAKEMSDTGVKSLRDVVKREFRQLFRIHALLKFPEARAPATNGEGDRVNSDEIRDYEQYTLTDDITLPVLSFDPVSRRDKSDRVKDAAAAYEKGVADLNEARRWVDLDPVKEEEVDDMMFRKDPTKMEDPTADDGEGGVGREQNQSEPDQNQGPGQGNNPNDDGTGDA